MTMTPERVAEIRRIFSREPDHDVHKLANEVECLQADNAVQRHALLALTYATEQFLAGRITASAMREQVAAALQEIK